MNRPLRLYIAGPMTGIPKFNIPLFDWTAGVARSFGYEVLSPAELDSPEVRAFALASPDGLYQADGKIAGESWGDMLARDVKVVADQVDGIILLPNWWQSRGARLEAFVGLLCKKEFYMIGKDDEPDVKVMLVNAEWVRTQLRSYMP